MRKITLLSLFSVASFLLSCGESKKAAEKDKNSAVAAVTTSESRKVSEVEVAGILEYLSSDELEGRKTGTEGIEKAAVFIEDIFEENGLKPYFDTYRDSFEVEGVTGYNLVGLKEGTDPELKNEYIIIGAHYDHIGTGKVVGTDTLANGANDNATGTTAVLELAKHFSGVDTKRSILFSLFSAEEMGLVGAKHLSQRLKEEEMNLYVMFNIEMVGIPMQGKDFKAYLTGFELSNLAEKFNQYSGEQVVGFLPQAQEYQLFRRSDNYPFYEAFKMPAQTISTFDFTNYDYYHHVSDEYQYMDVPFMTDLIQGIIPGITEMANTATQEIRMVE